MPRKRKTDENEGLETAFAAALLAVSIGTAWSAVTGSVDMTVIMGMVTAALAVALGFSGHGASG